jgi:hypothetical protein
MFDLDHLHTEGGRLRHKFGTTQIGVGERKDEELVGVRNPVSAGVNGACRKAALMMTVENDTL